MKGHVSRRGKTWAFWFDIDPDPLTGKRRQQTHSGFKSEKEAWKECRTAIADYERGHPVTASRRKVAAALDEWLTRIEHSIKPSMTQNWRNYAAYYVIPTSGNAMSRRSTERSVTRCTPSCSPRAGSRPDRRSSQLRGLSTRGGSVPAGRR
jgi:hypothetical protein